MSVVKKLLSLTAIVGSFFIITVQPGNCQYIGNDELTSNSRVCESSNTPPNNDVSSSPADSNLTVNRVNTAGTVRSMVPSNQEALLNIGVNAVELISVFWGLILLLACLRKISKPNLRQNFVLGVSLIFCGVSAPVVFNWLLSAARDANLFS